MAGSTVVDLTEIGKGMEFHAADGVTLGTIAEVWVGTDPLDSTTRCDEDTCSRLEVHERGGPLSIPYSAIAGVSGKSVTLNVDAATAHSKPWKHRPTWKAPPKARRASPQSSGWTVELPSGSTPYYDRDQRSRVALRSGVSRGRAARQRGVLWPHHSLGLLASCSSAIA